MKPWHTHPCWVASSIPPEPIARERVAPAQREASIIPEWWASLGRRVQLAQPEACTNPAEIFQSFREKQTASSQALSSGDSISIVQLWGQCSFPGNPTEGLCFTAWPKEGGPSTGAPLPYSPLGEGSKAEPLGTGVLRPELPRLSYFSSTCQSPGLPLAPIDMVSTSCW